MIKGVNIKKLKILSDERGFLVEILRCDDKIFHKFGQIYLTTINPRYIKAWHYHKKQTDNFFIVRGNARVVLYDIREDSETKGEINEFIMDEQKPFVLQIPHMVAHGVQALGKEPSYLINLPTELYNYKKPDEHRIDLNNNKIPYKWKKDENDYGTI